MKRSAAEDRKTGKAFIKKLRAAVRQRRGADLDVESCTVLLRKMVSDEYSVNLAGKLRELFKVLDWFEGDGPGPLRVLVPGNNDVDNAVYAGALIALAKEYLEFVRGRPVLVQVLVMGLGGHPTTGRWWRNIQFDSGTMKKIKRREVGKGSVKFVAGTSEASLLGQNIAACLGERGVRSVFVDEFGDAPGPIQLKLESFSTNTGENVRGAKAAFKLGATQARAPNFLIVSACQQAQRQLNTFAYQLVDEQGEPLFNKVCK